MALANRVCSGQASSGITDGPTFAKPLTLAATFMTLCKLCKNKPANQTGSHIFTYSLIKSAINEVGDTLRGKELTFGISSEDFFSLYFGQKIQPEKIAEVLGHEVTDEEIDNNVNPFTVDNIVCTACEKRFTSVENYFLDNIQNYLNDPQTKLVENKKYGGHLALNTEASLLLRVYFYIQMWRASVAKYDDFSLNSITEEKLRKIINATISVKIDETIENCNANHKQIVQFPLVVTHAQTIVDEHNKIKLTENLVYIDQYEKPNFFILNDFFIQFYEQHKHLSKSKKYFFGLSDILKNKLAINENEDTFIINQLSDTERLKVIKTLYSVLANQLVKNFIRDFVSNYIHQYGFIPDDRTILSALNKAMFKHKA